MKSLLLLVFISIVRSDDGMIENTLKLPWNKPECLERSPYDSKKTGIGRLQPRGPMKYMNCGPIDNGFFAMGQSNEDVKIYHRFFKNISYTNHSFFLEMGGLNGLTFSNTFIFEHCFGWKGMMIEANMLNFLEMTRNRPCTHNVWSAACPRGRSYLHMEGYNGTSKIIDIPVPNNR